ncbi:MAG: hypothetical protein FWB72_04615 [Firmicutes bacterium]|nr:hypothetical protein [Bacillota bacterium]
MKHNYKEIIKQLKKGYDVWQENEGDSFVYFMSDNINDGQLLLEERDEGIIIWNNDIKHKSFFEMYDLLLGNIKQDFYFPCVETKEEVGAILSLGGVEIDIEKELVGIELANDYSREYGSFVVREKAYGRKNI